MSEQEYRNWRLDYDLDGICWLTIDRAGESANSLSREVLTELEQIVTALEKGRPRGLVLQSGKPGSFIVGADVREFEQADNLETAKGFMKHERETLEAVIQARNQASAARETAVANPGDASAMEGWSKV